MLFGCIAVACAQDPLPPPSASAAPRPAPPTSAPSSPGSRYEGMRIAKIRIAGPAVHARQALIEMLSVKIGQPLGGNTVRQSLHHLYAADAFAQGQVHA